MFYVDVQIKSFVVLGVKKKINKIRRIGSINRKVLE